MVTKGDLFRFLQGTFKKPIEIDIVLVFRLNSGVNNIVTPLAQRNNKLGNEKY